MVRRSEDALESRLEVTAKSLVENITFGGIVWSGGALRPQQRRMDKLLMDNYGIKEAERKKGILLSTSKASNVPDSGCTRRNSEQRTCRPPKITEGTPKPKALH